MAKSVSVQFPPLPVGKVDCVFQVKDEGSVVGDLKVSKGGIEWRPKHKQHNGNTVKMSWKKFAQLVESAT